MKIKAPWGKKINLEPRAESIWNVLERGVTWQLEEHGTPSDPYDGTVAYRREPTWDGRRRDHYQPWWECSAQRHGDCEDLSMWLVAWLRATGQDNDARVALIEWPSGGWHAVVLRKGPMEPADHRYTIKDLNRIYGSGTRIYGGPDVGWDPRGEWYIEDPSRRLGMRDSARKTEYSPLATGDQREPMGRSVIGRDPYLPFEIAGAQDEVGIIRRFARYMDGE